jgi:hypothetical protein
VGQYRNYDLALSKEDSQRVLFLAIPLDVFEQFFTLPFVREAVVYNAIEYLVYDVQEEVIVLWQRTSNTVSSSRL